MASEFPDPDEEFDLLHEDEYEILREIEELERKKHISQAEAIEASQPKNKQRNEVHLNIPVTSQSKAEAGSSSIDNTKKRNYDELFGDISDIVDIDHLVQIHEPREKKPRWDEPQEIIKAVLSAREKCQERIKGISTKNDDCEHVKKNCISLRVPTWNFVAVTRPYDSQRIYIRVRSEKYIIQKSAQPISNLLPVPYSQLKAEAEEIIVKNVERASCQAPNTGDNWNIKNDELWVDKYRPKTYLELLSDESVNRSLLHWIKLWDKVVFNRNYLHSKTKKQHATFWNKKIPKEQTFDEIDNKGFPVQRIVLLSGPPGLGKTTLAHLAATHAGYNVVEINASDERSPDAFRQVLLASTQMKAVMGSDPRPNCLVLDEIDGAPAASIDLLLKFVQGKLVLKGKKGKGKTEKQTNTCHRPVICICNEPYTPSLRALRTTALIIAVPEVSPSRLTERLMEISRKEKIKVNPDALLKLAEVSGCDVRSCLGALQYMGKANLGDNLSFAMKDSRKGLFDSWKQILTIPINRTGLIPLPERVRNVLKTVQNGESEKLAQGVFHNYPQICNEKLHEVRVSLEWFQFFDEILSLIRNFQIWSIMPYTNYAFVIWHLYFAKTRNVKLSYPSVTYEVNQKLAKSTGILTTVQRSSGRDVMTLAVDISPFLPDLLSPRIRTISGHLQSSKERDDITRLVNILLEFGLTYTQERTLEGTYDYKLDPNIFEVGIFPDCKIRRMLVYAVKQIITQELEAERLRRIANAGNANNNTQHRIDNTSKDSVTKSKDEQRIQNGKVNVPNLLENTKKIDKQLTETKYKDFFGRVITAKHDKHKKSENGSTNFRDLLRKRGVWYKYKEGFSNAVRRNVLLQELL